MARSGRVCAAMAAGTMLAATVADAADARLGAGISSAHVWRGVTLNSTPVLEPELSVRGLKPFGASLAASVRGYLNIGDEGGLIPAAKLAKIDMEADLDLPHGFRLSYIEYAFPTPIGLREVRPKDVKRTTYLATREIALGWRARGWIEPSLTVYRDVGEIDDVFVELSLGRRLALSEQTQLDLVALASWAGKRFAEDHGSRRRGFHNYDLHARLTYRPLTMLNLRLYAAYTRTFRDSLPKQPVSFYGGVAASVSY